MNELANKILLYLNSAEGFLKEQTPDFISQFIAYEKWQLQWWFWFMIIISVILIGWQIVNVTTYYYTKLASGHDRADLVALMAIVGVVGTCAVYGTADDYAQIKKMEIAPKVYMVGKVKELFLDKTKKE